MEVTRKKKIKIPMLPNFLKDNNDTGYHVSEFTEKELRQLGKEWTDALVAHAKKKRS